MGAPDRLSFYFTKFFGFGIGFDTFPYDYNITIMLPFLTLDIGLGKPYTDKCESKKLHATIDNFIQETGWDDAE